MKHYDVAVVGAGPAGSICAGRLAAGGARVLLLDRSPFPRDKLCAGWLTPRVFHLLGIRPEDYPHTLTTFNWLDIRIRGVPIPRPGRQYAIRRIEFDAWLLKRSGVPLTVHEVRSLAVASGRFIIDGRWSADVLVGAGGSWCPVYRHFLGRMFPRLPDTTIVAMEEEFLVENETSLGRRHDGRIARGLAKTSFSGTTDCGTTGLGRLRFFDHGLPGYSWFLPKAGGYRTVGIGGVRDGLARNGSTIRDHWQSLTARLERSGLVRNHSWKPKGYVYHVRQGPLLAAFSSGSSKVPGRVFLVGDALGLATRDMGEGIGPAIESGLLAAEAILSGGAYLPEQIPAYSLVPKMIGERMFPTRSDRRPL